jgi:hypothetical protein
MLPTCPECKTPVEAGHRFCRSCGKDLAPQTDPEQTSELTRPLRFTWGPALPVEPIAPEPEPGAGDSEPEPEPGAGDGVESPSKRRTWVLLASVGLVCAVVAFAYFALKGRGDEAASKLAPSVNADTPEIVSRRGALKIEVEAGGVERDRLARVLQSYGFAPTNLTLKSKDARAYVLQFGRDIAEEDVRALALACRRSGINVAGVGPLKGVAGSVLKVGPAPPGAAAALTEQQIESMKLATAFPVVNKFNDLDNALKFAGQVKRDVTAYPVEVYLSGDNASYAVTLGGYLTEEEARKRVDFARQNNIGQGAWMQPAMNWGENLFRQSQE